jgi:UDP-N-acetylmuramoyl-tripeptide--D-alanyl-D-alanine ligase
MLTLAEIAASVSGSRLYGAGATRIESVSTDSRTAGAGCVFFALRGERFDAHDFVADVVARGARAVVVERRLQTDVAQLVVADTRRALGYAAAAWRARFDLPLIAVTGSNGKTTVTQMISGILAEAFGAERRLATRGNLNNEIGVPLMLFELGRRHRAAVLELGMNHAGEIAWLAQLARPSVALVNNAQREHQEFLGGIEATAHENGAVIAALGPVGVAVFPSDDGCAGIWRQLAGTRRVLDFAREGAAAVTAEYQLRPDGSALSIAVPAGVIEVALRVAGEHNVHNALAAAAATLALDVPIAAIRRGLEGFGAVAGRGVTSRLRNGAVLVDDSYNANPDSVRAAIDLLSRCPSPRVLVLGDMGEVGEQGPAFHGEVGAYARRVGVDTLLCLGNATVESVAAFGAGARHCPDVETLIEAAQSAAAPDATLLVKGSRFMRMERVVNALRNDAGAAQAAGVH